MPWQGDSQTWAAGCDKLLATLEKEYQKAVKKNDENKAKKRAKWQSLIDVYKTEEDVMDAYGYAMITEKQREDLLAQLAAGEEKVMELDVMDAYIHLLKSFMSDLRKEKECLLEEG